MRRILVVSMPFRIGVGGFIRSWHVLPRLSRHLAEDGYEVELWIPANAIRTVLMLHIKQHQENIGRDIFDELPDLILNEISYLERQSKYSFNVNEKVLRKNLEFNLSALKSEVGLIEVYSLSRLLFVERLRPALTYIFEKKFVDDVKHLIETPQYIYSMHETPDAVTVLLNLGKKSTKTVVLLQSDLGKDMLGKSFNLTLFRGLSRKTSLRGLLSVSPAPIIETPELYKLCSNVRILVPSLAIDDIVLKYVENHTNVGKKRNAVIYFGRISREKGIFDLLKAWSIIEHKSDALLYITGAFEDRKTELEFRKLVSKYKLRNTIYLGYLDRNNKLFNVVSRCSILAYPSYRDSFSLTVLEALFMQLKVVSYDIPAIRYIYRASSNIKLVPLGNIERFAQAILKVLEEEFVLDAGTLKIMNMYSSWERVAAEEYKNLRNLFS